MLVDINKLLLVNVFKIRLIIELEKLLVHSSMVESVVEPWSNRWRRKYIIYILYKIKNNYKN